MGDEWQGFMAVVGIVIAFGGAVAFCLVLRGLRRFELRVLETLSGMERDLRIIGVTLNDAGHRVEDVEGNLRTLQHAQHSLESRATGSTNYAQAINLVQRGWRMEDLVSSCGLTRGEAELVYMLHGPGGGLNANRGLSKRQ